MWMMRELSARTDHRGCAVHVVNERQTHGALFSQVGRDIETMLTLWTIPPFPIPTAAVLFDERVIDVGPIGQEHISNRATLLGEAVSLKRDFLRVRLHRRCLLGQGPATNQ